MPSGIYEVIQQNEWHQIYTRLNISSTVEFTWKKKWRKTKTQCREYIFDVVKETKFILSSYFTVTGCHAIL